jgi:ABC-type transport system involved in Fe-S cluster assembly fused permease/ATPase subunit
MRGMGRMKPDLPDKGRSYDLKAIRLMLPFLWPKTDPELRVRLVMAVCMLGAIAGLNTLAPMLFAKAVDGLASGANLAVVLPLGLILSYGLVHSIGKAINELRWLLYSPIEQRLTRNVGLTLFRHVHDLSLSFHLSRRTGQLSRIIDNGTSGLNQILASMVFMILPLVAEIGFIVAVLLWQFEPVYTLIIVGTFLLYGTALVIGSEWLRKQQRLAVVENTMAHGKAVDSILNYETVKYFGNEAHVAERYDTSLAEVERLTVKAMMARSVTGVIQVLILGTGLTGMVVLAGSQVTAGEVTVGGFVLVNTYLLQVLRPLDRLGNIYRGLKVAFTEVEQMMGLLHEAPEVTDAPGAKELPPGRGGIVFRDVAFSYDPRRPVLKGLSFDLAPGQSLGLVGESGTGKTTVGRLLFRFYDPIGGTVEIDGLDLKGLTVASVRGAIGVVPQDAVLFNDSIYYNISFGRPDCTEKDVRRAAQLAHIDGFIDTLPEGYDTVVGERGLKLSGGEKQRVAIARAILKSPRIFLFDEATSALDTRTERAIQENLREVSRGTTTVIIAHRLSTVIHADQILVLEDGKIMEHGTHDSLLRDGGRYAALWAKQQEKIELDAAD